MANQSTLVDTSSIAIETSSIVVDTKSEDFKELNRILVQVKNSAEFWDTGIDFLMTALYNSIGAASNDRLLASARLLTDAMELVKDQLGQPAIDVLKSPGALDISAQLFDITKHIDPKGTPQEVYVKKEQKKKADAERRRQKKVNASSDKPVRASRTSSKTSTSSSVVVKTIVVTPTIDVVVPAVDVVVAPIPVPEVISSVPIPAQTIVTPPTPAPKTITPVAVPTTIPKTTTPVQKKPAANTSSSSVVATPPENATKKTEIEQARDKLHTKLKTMESNRKRKK